MSDWDRLGQHEGPGLVSMLERRGYRVSTRPNQSPSSRPAPITAIYIWKPNPKSDTDENTYLGCIRWVKKIGWRMELVLPPLHTHQELSLALAQLDGTKEALREADTLWGAFKQRKNKGNWRDYLGVLAAFYTGGYKD